MSLGLKATMPMARELHAERLENARPPSLRAVIAAREFIFIAASPDAPSSAHPQMSVRTEHRGMMLPRECAGGRECP